jgi:MFS family permease
MIAGLVFAMLGSSSVPAALPALIAQWHLSAAEAGWLSGAYFLGYAISVPVLVSLTDRIDSRWIFAIGCCVGVVAGFGFAFFARGLWLGIAFSALGGVSLAGAYMPGLRVILDRVGPSAGLRAVPYYTASFGVGVSVSFFVAGSALASIGWHAAFEAGGLGCIIAPVCLLLATIAAPSPLVASGGGSGAFNLAAVLRNRAALRYVVAYGGHCWELFALRSWLVALLLFMWHRSNGPLMQPGNVLTYWSSAISLVGVPASIVGAECALRFGRPRLIIVVALASIALALATAVFGLSLFTAGAVALIFYSVAILGDSGAITAGLVDAANPGEQGSTLALHSLVGFVGGALGPIAVGFALSVSGWPVALAVMAAGSAAAAVSVLGAKTEAP